MVHLTHKQLRYLLIQHLLPAVLVNFLINFVCGWLFFHHKAEVHLWESFTFTALPSSIAIDLIPTTFFLVFFTGLIVSLQVASHLGQGRVAPVLDAVWFPRMGPLNRPMASLRTAGAITLILVPAALLVFHWNEIGMLPFWEFVWFKSVYAAVLAALFTPFVVVRSLAG